MSIYRDADVHIAHEGDPGAHERGWDCPCQPERLWGNDGELIAVHHWIGEDREEEVICG